MRGTHPSARLYVRCCGIIPAYAGNTGLMSANDLPIRDHPRVCGEHALFASAKAEPLGSSPRMRGTPRGIHLGYVGHGIIPAYAGNTIIRSRSRKMRWDHPRVCGEHANEIGASQSVAGSSPRMRGTLDETCAIELRYGIIPAYAGNTVHRNKGYIQNRDHPRVCGEHLKEVGQ